MNTKTAKIIYWISTGLLTLLMLGSAGMYFAQTAQIQETFEGLGYPAYIVIPLGILKLLGLVAIWFIPNQSLKEWAYAGFFFDALLAFFAHIMVGDGQFPGALAGVILVLTSYFSRKRAFLI